MVKIRDIQGWKVVDSSGTAHDVIDARVGSRHVWPVVENVVLHYSGGYSYILASGANYAWITATVNGVANVTLTPVLDAESTAFYIDGNHIRAYSRGTVVGDARSISVHATYLLVETASVTVAQQANARESLVITSADLSVTFDSADIPSIPCSQTVLNAYAHITRHLESTYTSGAVAQTTDNLGDINIYYNGVKVDTVTDGGYSAVNVGGNNHNLDARTVTITAYYSNWSGSGSTGQDPDTYQRTGTTLSDYFADITTSTYDISAAGGSATLEPTAYHKETPVYTWGSDGATFNGDPVTVEDTPTITGTASYFSRSGMTVRHDNMGTREETDSITYTVTNGDASATITFFATNTKSVKTAAYDTTTGFRISLSTVSVACTGGTITVSGAEIYSHTDTIYQYTSGATSGGASTAGLTRAATPTVTADQDATVSGVNVTIPSRVQNTQQTTYTITGTWGAYTDSEEADRLGDTYTATDQNYDYWVDITTSTSSISAAGGSATLDTSAGHRRRTKYDWASGGTTYSAVTNIEDTASISGSADYYTRSGMTVRHDNMGTREETDSVTYTATNNGATDSITFSVQNRLESTTPETTEITEVWFNFDPDHFDRSGGTTELYLTIFTTTTAVKYTYTSGTTSGGEQFIHEEDVDPTSLRSLVSWCYANSNTMLTATTNYTGSSRTAEIEAVWGGNTYTGEITQYY